MDIGTRLSEARRERALTLSDISRVTKIPVKCLEAIDRNDIDRLPGGIFARAFLRSYAAEVGLDPNDVVHEYCAQRQDEWELPLESFEAPSGEGQLTVRRSLSRLVLILAIGVAFGTWFLRTSDNSAASAHQSGALPLGAPEVIAPASLLGSAAPLPSPLVRTLQRDVQDREAAGEKLQVSFSAPPKTAFATEARDAFVERDGLPGLGGTSELPSVAPAIGLEFVVPSEYPTDPSLT